MNYTLHLGDCIEVLKTLPAGSVQTCITSPPYFGLRDYGVSGQIGLEESPAAYVAKLVDVFREVRRVLRDDGVIWVNLGDSYAGSGRGLMGDGTPSDRGDAKQGTNRGTTVGQFDKPNWGCKPKDLIGIPWRVAFALQADGWYLRSDIIWHKPNPMPESVRDRPTKAHEYIFLLSKNPRYFYDADAVREPHADGNTSRLTALKKYGDGAVGEWVPGAAHENSPYLSQLDHRGLPGVGTTFGQFNSTGRNRRSVWTITPKPFKGAHFAVFPEALVEPCILAGTSERGQCSACGAPWVRVVERTREHGLAETAFPKTNGLESQNGHKRLHQRIIAARAAGEPHDNPLGGTHTVGWQPSCTCNALIEPQTVLDPFAGSGTTGLVALQHGRRFVGIELNADYLEMVRQRIGSVQPRLREAAD